MKPCGHVICRTCTDSLVAPSSQCVKCDAKLGPKDTIELLREGKDSLKDLYDADQRNLQALVSLVVVEPRLAKLELHSKANL
jgi:myo-inositol catabolism protein IolC